MNNFLEIQHISCHYSDSFVVNNASFSLQRGELACLLGPSGCGKTTILRALAGFQTLDNGTIRLDGKCISDTTGNLPPEKRNMSMVFQDHALFPHLSIEENVAAGLLKHSQSEKRSIVMQMLERVGLQGKSQKYPHELSGGQQQRIALARALAPQPKLLLMDEPYSSLDVDLRTRLGQEVRELLKEMDTTCLMVTHDQQDAFTLADHVGVMKDGEIQQWDTPYNLYHEPQTRFVADFVGDGILLEGVVLENNRVQTELAVLQGDCDITFDVGEKVEVLVRPDDIIHDDESNRSAKIKKKAFRGESYLYTLELSSRTEILSLVQSHHNHAIGEDLGIKLEIDHLVLFPNPD